jgi:hypothetical protein
MSGVARLSRGPTANDRRQYHRFANVLDSPLPVNITDGRHFLADKGAIAPSRGPAKAMAGFHGGVIVYATDFDDVGVLLPRCFKCGTGGRHRRSVREPQTGLRGPSGVLRREF